MNKEIYRGRAWCGRCGPLGELWAYSLPALTARMSAVNREHHDKVHPQKADEDGDADQEATR